MLRRAGRHVQRNLVAYLALFVALGGTSYAAVKVTGTQVVDGSLTGKDIRDRSLQAADIRKGTLRADLFARGQLNGATVASGPQGPQGPKGDAGPAGAAGPAGPTFGDGVGIPNLDNFACSTDVKVAERIITVTRPSRVLAFANGAILDGGSAATEFGMSMRLLDFQEADVLAVTSAAWDSDGQPAARDEVMPLSVTSMLFAGSGVGAAAGAPIVLQPGQYRLQLMIIATGAACGAALPDFGYNQGSGMGYVLLGNG